MMDVHKLYTKLAYARSMARWAEAYKYPALEQMVRQARVSALAHQAQLNRNARMKTLELHGVEYVEQDEQVYALGTCNTATGIWTWENVTTCNLKHWLGY